MPELMHPVAEPNGLGVADPQAVAELRRIMAADVGVVRDAAGLRRALAAIDALPARRRLDALPEHADHGQADRRGSADADREPGRTLPLRFPRARLGAGAIRNLHHPRGCRPRIAGGGGRACIGGAPWGPFSAATVSCAVAARRGRDGMTGPSRAPAAARHRSPVRAARSRVRISAVPGTSRRAATIPPPTPRPERCSRSRQEGVARRPARWPRRRSARSIRRSPSRR